AGADRIGSDGCAVASLPNGGKPGDEVEGGEAAERDEEPGFGGKHGAYAMRVGRKCKTRAYKRRPRGAKDKFETKQTLRFSSRYGAMPSQPQFQVSLYVGPFAGKYAVKNRVAAPRGRGAAADAFT